MSGTASKTGCCHKHSGSSVNYAFGLGLVAGAVGTALALALVHCGKSCKKTRGCNADNSAAAGPNHWETSSRFTIADQPARFARDKAANNVRVLDIDQVFEPEYLRGKAVLVTGGNRGLGFAIVKAAAACGARVYATCRRTNDELNAVSGCTVIEGIEVTSDEAMEKLVAALEGVTIDVLINNAGYFFRDVEKLDSLAFDEESAMIEICAIGSLRVTSALWNAGRLASDGSAKIIMITSQGGSIAWRPVQNAPGADFAGDYGHHMSKAASNMMGKLVSLELQGKAMVGIFHPGFNRTDMTAKYAHIWDIEGAVDPSVGAKRVLHEVNLLTPESSGKFINCEDGLEIPW